MPAPTASPPIASPGIGTIVANIQVDNPRDVHRRGDECRRGRGGGASCRHGRDQRGDIWVGTADAPNGMTRLKIGP